MKATKEQIRDWHNEGVEGSFDYMIIVEINEEDHPIYWMEDEPEVRDQWLGSIVEIYHLQDDFNFAYAMNKLVRSKKQVLNGPVLS
jgi:hypothetical protein